MINHLIIVFAFISGVFQTQSDSLLDRYPFKSGMIKYQYEGRTNCTELIYFDDYGELYYDMKTFSVSENGSTSSSKVKILRQDTVILLNIESKTASQCLIKDFTLKIKQNIITVDMLFNMGYSLTGSDEVSGIICKRYSGENGTMWVWNNIILKSEMIIMNINIKMEATEILTGVQVADSKFKRPKNYKLIN